MQFDDLVGGEDSLSVLEAALYDGQRLVAKATQELPVGGRGTVNHTLHMENLGAIELWGLKTPKLYRVEVRLLHGGQVLDSDERRIGFREAKFTPQGFSLNGTVVKLRGLDRHQTFPWVGQAMPGRVQRRDAVILRKNLKCNIVRTSHYPQSRHFLDACDEIGLLVLEEIPGWQHIGDQAWKDLSVDNVEPHDSPRLEPSFSHSVGRAHQRVAGRPRLLHANQCPGASTGSRRGRPAASATFYDSELLEDVFTMNDFGFPLETAESSAVSEHGVRRPHVSHQDDRQHRAPARTHAAPCAHPRSAGLQSAVRRRHRLVRVRLQHARQLRIGRPHLLPRRHGYLPRAKAGGGILQVAVRSGGRDCARAGIPLGAWR